MKRRRSARPVVVEIKRTRLPVSAKISTVRTKPRHVLWRNAPLSRATTEIDRDLPQPVEASPPPSDPIQQPVRRILPTLTPVIMPSETLPDAAQKKRRSQRAGRQRSTGTLPSSSIIPSDFTALADQTTAMARHEPKDTPPEVDVRDAKPGLEPRPTKRGLRSGAEGASRVHQGEGLRRGEFWKRRLPRVCW